MIPLLSQDPGRLLRNMVSATYEALLGWDGCSWTNPGRRRCRRGEGDHIAANGVEAALHRVCLDVVAELSLLGATIAVMTPDGAEASAAASSEAVQAVAELQFALGEGPCRDAFALSRPVLVPDLGAGDGRWVGFTPAALVAGVSGIYAFPLGLGAAPLGVLTCYCTAGDTLDTAQLRRCLSAADRATSLLLTPHRPEDPEEPGAPEHVPSGATQSDPAVQRSLHIRTEVYQAQGMLTAELGIGLSDAMARLRAIAYAEEVPLNDLAADLVAGRRDFPENDTEQHR